MSKKICTINCIDCEFSLFLFSSTVFPMDSNMSNINIEILAIPKKCNQKCQNVFMFILGTCCAMCVVRCASLDNNTNRQYTTVYWLMHLNNDSAKHLQWFAYINYDLNWIGWWCYNKPAIHTHIENCFNGFSRYTLSNVRHSQWTSIKQITFWYARSAWLWAKYWYPWHLLVCMKGEAFSLSFQLNRRHCWKHSSQSRITVELRCFNIAVWVRKWKDFGTTIFRELKT